MAKKYDDFDEADQDGLFDQIFNIISKRRREFAIVSVSAAVILLGLVVWGSYPKSEKAAQNESVPIVRADAGDYKVAPDNPGGMEIPYRDSTVFSSTEGQKPENVTENILADDSTEQPLPKSQLFAGLNTDGEQSGGAPVTEEDDSEIAAVPQSDAPASAPQPSPAETAAATAKVDPVTPPSNDTLVKEAIGVPPVASPAAATKTATATVPAEAMKATILEEKTQTPAKVEEIQKAEKAAKIESAAGAASAAKAVKPGGYYVQLASVKSESGAAGEFKKLQAKYAGLNGLKFRTQEANLGPKGLFYRIQAGPMSKDSAASVCASVKKSGGSCLVAAK